VTLPYLRTFTEGSGVPDERLVLTLPEHGNLASASLAFGLSTALEQGRAGPGDKVALIGLAGGVSMGVLFAEL
jgi:acyl-CoA:acyl-CoA alkyltransferase